MAEQQQRWVRVYSSYWETRHGQRLADQTRAAVGRPDTAAATLRLDAVPLPRRLRRCCAGSACAAAAVLTSWAPPLWRQQERRDNARGWIWGLPQTARGWIRGLPQNAPV
mmetsp:Transcript_21269/g.63758  ORF Transcript_21269/g.63758 Transcript_21269/m.63758 type:complete len:110 (+) Transcript_21269:852-1181(+)